MWISPPFAKNLSVDAALDVMGGNYTVDKVPCKYKGKPVPGYFYTVRKDTDAVLGVVGAKYHIIQPKPAFDILEVIGGNVELYTGSVLGLGEKMCIVCKLPSTTKIAGELVEHYFVLLNSFNGSSSLILIMTPLRPACWNIVNFMIKRAVRRANVRHTRNYEQQLAEAARVLGISKNYYTQFDDIVKQLLTIKRTEKQFDTLVATLLGKPDDDASERKQTLYENQRELMYEAYNATNLENVRGTGWHHYNAVADFADHARHSRGADEARKAANRFMRTFMNTSLKDRAFELILAGGKQ
jgi:phage/plasmid-like protein (TIGR03299 family)